MKAWAAFASVLLIGAQAFETEPNGYFIPLDLVVRIVCSGPDGTVTGSGSFIDGRRVLSAAHVTYGRKCSIFGVPVNTVHEDTGLDVSLLETSFPAPSRLVVSCAEQKAGDDAFGVGYAKGKAFVVQRYVATAHPVKGGKPFGGLMIYRGTAYHGMSGGPVFDGNGQVIGIVNAINDNGAMMSRSVRDTWLCAG